MVGGVTTTGLVLLGLTGLSGVVGVAFAVVFHRTGRDVPGTTPYVRWLLVSAGCAVATFLSLVVPGQALTSAFQVVYTGFLLASVGLWLEFALEYTGRDGQLTGRRRAAMYGYFAAYVLAVLTNPVHKQFLVDVELVGVEGLTALAFTRTPLMWSQTVVVYSLIGVGIFAVARFFFATRNTYRKQTGAILLGSLIVSTGSLAYWLGLTPIPEFDPTSVLFVVNALIIGVALVRYDFLEVVPLAADMLIEVMDDPVIVVDADETVLDVNAAGTALFEGDPVGEPLDAVAPALAAAVAAGAQYASTDTDDQTTYDPRTTAITDHHGIERGTLVVLRDVTEQVRRQVALERQNERLEEFAAVVSHDLRNPLSVAHAYAQTAVTEEDLTLVPQVVDSLDRMNELIEDLLALARDGRTVDAVTAVPVAALARRAWSQVETADASLVVSIDSDALVLADEHRLKQLLENLFRNAVEHAGHGVTVEVESLPDRTGFAVTDDGPGIPADARDAVFDHGYTSSADGTGFGLAIVRTIAEAHGWTISVTDGDSGGARFEIRGVAWATKP